MSRAISISWIHLYVSFLLDCRRLHLTFKKANFLNTLSDPWSSEYSNYDERSRGIGGYFQSWNDLLFKANFCDFCVCVPDIWSLGVILYMLVCGVPPFQETNDSETLVMILDCRYSIPEHVSDECREWVKSQLTIKGPPGPDLQKKEKKVLLFWILYSWFLCQRVLLFSRCRWVKNLLTVKSSH